jgi:hypothetical protein
MKMPEFTIFEDLFTASQIERFLATAKETLHHDDEGHGGGGHHIEAIKSNYLPEIAGTIYSKTLDCVDPYCKLYRLLPNSSAVAPHRDTDFVTSTGLFADWSVLVYLTDAYEGGETIFDGVTVCPHLRAGSVLMFPHSLLHEGRRVISGEKIVLKTDLLRAA